VKLCVFSVYLCGKFFSWQKQKKQNLARMDFDSLMRLRNQVDEALIGYRSTLEKQLEALGSSVASFTFICMSHRPGIRYWPLALIASWSPSSGRQKPLENLRIINLQENLHINFHVLIPWTIVLTSLGFVPLRGEMTGPQHYWREKFWRMKDMEHMAGSVTHVLSRQVSLGPFLI